MALDLMMAGMRAPNGCRIIHYAALAKRAQCANFGHFVFHGLWLIFSKHS
jgi:hypothetical protein